MSVARDIPHNRGRVLTMRENDLMSSLMEAKGPNVEWGVKCVGLSKNSNGSVCLSFDGDREDYECDLVVGADGPRSLVRSIAFGHLPLAKPTGWIAYSAISKLNLDIDSSFETLGPRSRRLACVPLAGGTQFWFFTLPAHPKYHELLDSQSICARALSDFLLENEGAQSWHEPIPTLLNELKSQNATDELHVVRREIFEETQPLESLSDPSSRFFVIGDAAHAIPNNLAQGASLCIEDAAELAHALNDHMARHAGVADPVDRLHVLAKQFDSSRIDRVRRCQLVTKFTQLISDTPGFIRDPIMSMVPGPLNARIFDAFLDYSLYIPNKSF